MSDLEVEAFLEHYGVKGMRWGVRNDNRPSGVSRKTNREAKKDAKEYSRAKAFYGKGAGTRRKLIKQTIEGKEKRISGYRKALDYHLENQDSSKHVSKAVSERKRKDRGEKSKQTIGAVARQATGQRGTQAAFVAALSGGAAYLNSPSGKRTMNKVKAKSVSLVEEVKRKQGAAHINKIFNDLR